MKLVVFGANGPTGRQVARQALIAGHDVAAVTRHPDRFPVKSPHLEVVEADVTDPDGVGRVLTGADAVISCFGVPYGKASVTVYSDGISNIARAMTDQGIHRLVCVSSDTVATEDAAGAPWFRRRILKPFLRNRIGRTVYDDMERMENIVRASSLNWTIARPCLLFDGPEPTTDYLVASRRLPDPYTSRADLADALVTVVDDGTYSRSTIAIVTRSHTPSFAAVFLSRLFGAGD